MYAIVCAVTGKLYDALWEELKDELISQGQAYLQSDCKQERIASGQSL